MRKSFCFILFYLCLISFGNLLSAQQKIVLQQTKKSGIVLFRDGKNPKIYLGNTDILGQKRKLKRIVSQSYAFFEPTHVKDLMRKTSNKQCGDYINIVGDKFPQKRTLKTCKEVFEYILFDEEIFEIFLYKNGKLVSIGYTFAFCYLKE